jgi:Tir chaperone protein (CesT) family
VSETPLTIQPIYADRASDQTFPDARSMVNAYLTRFGERAGSTLDPLDPSGYTLVRKGSASVGINVLDDHGVLLFVAPVMRVPSLSPIAREAFYRRLLELSFLTTSDAAFAIDADRDEVVVRALRRLSGLDYEEFEDLLETVGKVADDWDDTLRAEFAEK